VQSASAPITHRFINVDGIDTLYREAGPGDAPAVLLPHGEVVPLVADFLNVAHPPNVT
jgi:hypothetical protein